MKFIYKLWMKGKNWKNAKMLGAPAILLGAPSNTLGRRNRKKKDARAVVVAVGTKIGGRRRPYGHCSFIYVIRVNDIFAISPYVLVAQQK